MLNTHSLYLYKGLRGWQEMLTNRARTKVMLFVIGLNFRRKKVKSE